jgi:hypothetical protein
MVSQGVLEAGQEPPRERIYPPVGTPALDLLYDALDAEPRASGSWTAGPRRASRQRLPSIATRFRSGKRLVTAV